MILLFLYKPRVIVLKYSRICLSESRLKLKHVCMSHVIVVSKLSKGRP